MSLGHLFGLEAELNDAHADVHANREQMILNHTRLLQTKLITRTGENQNKWFRRKIANQK
jgi:hypothetical protein